MGKVDVIRYGGVVPSRTGPWCLEKGAISNTVDSHAIIVDGGSTVSCSLLPLFSNFDVLAIASTRFVPLEW